MASVAVGGGDGGVELGSEMRWKEGCRVLVMCLALSLAFHMCCLTETLQQPMMCVLLSFVPILQMKKLFPLSKVVVSRTPQVHQESVGRQSSSCFHCYIVRNARNNQLKWQSNWQERNRENPHLNEAAWGIPWRSSG